MRKAERIAAIRNSLGWTQSEAAVYAGYSERVIRKIEAGNPVRSRTLIDVLTAYHNAASDPTWQVCDFLHDGTSPDGTALTEANEKRVVDYFDVVFNQRQQERIGEFISADIRFTAEGRTERGIAVIEQRAATLLNAFSPIEHTIDEIFSREDTVHCFWSVKMKHVGDFLGIKPKGMWVRARGNSAVKIVDGLCVETEDQWDVEHVIRQLQGEGPVII